MDEESTPNKYRVVRMISNQVWGIPIRVIGGYLFYEMAGQLRPVSTKPMTWGQFCQEVDEANAKKAQVVNDGT